MHRRQRATPTKPAWARPVRRAPRRPRRAGWSSIRGDRLGFRPADGPSGTSAPVNRVRPQPPTGRRPEGESGSEPSSDRRDTHQYVAGLTGSGKTFVACALAHQACRQHQSVLYRRVPELVAALTRARDKDTLERLMGRLGRVSPAGPRRLGAAGLLRRGPARPAGDRGGAPRTQVHPRRQSDPRGALAERGANDRRRGPRPHRSQRLSHRAQGRVPAQALQAAATRRRQRQMREPGLAAGSMGACGAVQVARAEVRGGMLCVRACRRAPPADCMPRRPRIRSARAGQRPAP